MRYSGKGSVVTKIMLAAALAAGTVPASALAASGSSQGEAELAAASHEHNWVDKTEKEWVYGPTECVIQEAYDEIIQMEPYHYYCSADGADVTNETTSGPGTHLWDVHIATGNLDCTFILCAGYGSFPIHHDAVTETRDEWHWEDVVTGKVCSVCGESEELAEAEAAESSALAARDAAQAKVDELAGPETEQNEAKADAAAAKSAGLDRMKSDSEEADAVAASAKAEKEAAAAELAGCEADKKAADAAVSTAQADLAAAEKTRDAAKAAYEEAEKANDDTIIGFFTSLGDENAADIVRNPETRSGVADTNTRFGSSADATTLWNVSNGILTLEQVNKKRKSVGLTELKVSTTLMAVSEIQCNYAAKYRNHMVYAGVSSTWPMASECLAFGYEDPVSGWYDSEKAIFDEAVAAIGGPSGLAGKSAYDYYQSNKTAVDNYLTSSGKGGSGAVGHYINIINPNVDVAAASWTRYSTDAAELATSYAAYLKADKTYTTSEMRALLKTFMENGGADISAEKAAYDAAQAAYDKAKGALDDAQAKQAQAATAYDSAKNRNESAQKAYDAAKERSDGLSSLRTESGREAAFSDGITDSWIVKNDSALVKYVDEQRAAYAKAQEQVESLQAQVDANASALATARSELDAAQAAYDKARDAAIEQRAAYYKDNPFPDVSASEYYYNGVYYSAARKLMTGYDDGTFGPANVLTRGQLATVLWRAACPAEAAAYDASGAVNETGMADVPGGTYYTAAANWAVANKVINGFDEGDHREFRPDEPVTMEQFSTILVNYSGMADAAKADKDKYAAALKTAITDSDAISDWALASVGYAVSQKWFGGYENGDGTRTLVPGESLSRGRAATVLYNMGFAKEDPSKR